MAEEIAKQKELHVRKVQPIMDQAMVFGLVCGFGMILAVFTFSGSSRSFINIPSVLIAIGGPLDDLMTIALSTSVAPLITIYGAVLANMVFLPLATKLEWKSTEQTLVSSICVMGLFPIRHQVNPHRLGITLNSILPPSKRVRYFD